VLVTCVIYNPLAFLFIFVMDMGKTVSVLNDSWPCTDDSLWEIQPINVYTDKKNYFNYK
jgi:hypothetical protein